MQKSEILDAGKELEKHLVNELLPFWLNRCKDNQNGGFITHFDQNGNDTGLDEKSLISQTRTLFTMASAHRAGFGNGKCRELAEHGARFLLDKMWDEKYGGFFWMCDRKGGTKIDRKILYGHSFAIYSLSEYFLATGDHTGIELAEKVFDLILRKCLDSEQGGYFEMFDRKWQLSGPGLDGGDRKTFDVHMHLMEAFTNLFEATRDENHRQAAISVIVLLLEKMVHPEHGTAISQFTPNWVPASHIKFDIVWGHDRFSENGIKANPEDTTSFGHNLEFAWLLLHSIKILDLNPDQFLSKIRKLIDHGVKNGIDQKYGGLFVEGSHEGDVFDREKEFWQQAEALIALLDAVILFKEETYWNAYQNVHRFVFNSVINHNVGEWWPLLTRDGKPNWTHMGDSWKINYHTVRSMIQSINRLDILSGMLD